MTLPPRWLAALLLAIMSFAITDGLHAQQPVPAEQGEKERLRELSDALGALRRAAKAGPEAIPLLDQGTIRLPSGYVFVPKAEGARVMRAFGNRTGDNFLGLVYASADDLNWFATLVYNKSGYVKDEDAQSWNADELLEQLKSGTEEGNKDRVQRGFKEIEVAGWVQKPNYDPATHRLIWSALVRDKGGTDNGHASVNYNTYALGREGFFQLNLIADESRIELYKRHAPILLGALDYTAGKAYGDFEASTDKVAAFGLAALIAGAAAKKLGLIAVIAAFAIKAWKIVALAVFGGLAIIGRLFKRKSKA